MPQVSSPSFFALISDIHANIDALDAVLADIKKWPVKAVLCLGDIIGYGPEPAACLQRVADTCAVTVLGNHDTMLFLPDDLEGDGLRPEIVVPIKLAAKQLSEDQVEWLRTRSLTADLDPITLTHANLHDPIGFDYLINEHAIVAHFAAQATFISFVGHTHLPMVWEDRGNKINCYQAPEKPVRLDADRRFAVNVGSVGQPRDGDTRACYALYDYENRILQFRRVEYDLKKAQARFKKAKLPASNAKRLSEGR